MFIGQFGNQQSLINTFQMGKSQAVGRASISDLLQRISTNFTDAHTQRTELESAQRVREAELDAYNQKIDDDQKMSGLRGLSTDELKAALGLYQMFSRSARAAEAELTAVHDQLAAYDQTIQEYQSILDGQMQLPDGMTLENVAELLETTKTARQMFLEDKVPGLNESVGDMVDDDGNYSGTVLGERRSAGMSKEEFLIDINSEDIYAELDKMREGVQGYGKMWDDAILAIEEELERRGEGLTYTAADGRTAIPDISQSQSMDMILEYMKRAFEQQAMLDNKADKQ